MAASLELVIRAIDQASGVLGRVDGSANKLSDTLRKNISRGALVGGAALLGLGTSAVVLAAKFEETLSKIAGLTETPASAIDGLRDQILKLSTEVAKSPEELGAGAYFILSSGITDVNTAMTVLEHAAKASAAGLGETQVIADALTSVMNAYQLSAEDAGKVTDTLVNIVKFGKGEPAEMAASLGRIIPVAAQVGVEFEQLGAVLATLTNTGLNAEESVTAIRGILNQIISPSEAAAKKFTELGLPLEEFRKQVDENFVVAMQSLMDATGGSEEALAVLFPEIRGLTGVMAAFGNQADQTAHNLAGIQNGAGAAERAFATAGETANFKFRQAITSLNVILTKVGLQLLPGVTKALGAFSEWMTRNEDDINRVIAALGEFAASEAFPFLEKAFLQLVQLIEGIKNTGIIQWLAEHKEVALALALALGVLLIAFGGPIVTIIALVAVGTILLSQWDAMRNKVEELIRWMREHKTEMTAAGVAIAVFLGPLGILIGTLILLVTHWHTVVSVINNVVIPAFNIIASIIGVTVIPYIELYIAVLTRLFSTTLTVGGALATPFNVARDAVDWLIRRIRDLINIIKSIPSPGDIIPDIGIPDVNPFQHGGTVLHRGLQLVGERGPELASLPVGTRIFPAHETAAMLGGGNLTLHVEVNFNSAISDASPGAMHRAGQLVARVVREELKRGR